MKKEFREFCYDHEFYGKTRIKLLRREKKTTRYEAKILEGGMLDKFRDNIIYVAANWIRHERKR